MTQTCVFAVTRTLVTALDIYETGTCKCGKHTRLRCIEFTYASAPRELEWLCILCWDREYGLSEHDQQCSRCGQLGKCVPYVAGPLCFHCEHPNPSESCWNHS
jgi:hypothetical protein